MHDLADKNKYIGFLFMRINPEYFALGREGIHEIVDIVVGMKAPPRGLANRSSQPG